MTTNPGDGALRNRLDGARSPYLLQHARNPVAWQPWDAEALDLARTLDRPIFLSIGYAACHWCHVMEHECFEDAGIADLLNTHFVSIKVDREERPDLDAIYMTAVQALTGRGGWPMSVFLTPPGDPFYGGTYFPREDYGDHPGFRTILQSLVRAWREQRDTLTEAGRELTGMVRRRVDDAPRGAHGTNADAIRDLLAGFDEHRGGFGGAPKFPNTTAIELLLREHHATGASAPLHAALHTLRAMARGGIRDHLGGGFHRYAVDADWRLPHFEKMLYDNALLASAYIDAFRLTGDASFLRVATGTLDYLLRDMRDPGGGFHASEDADSVGEEGAWYLWTRKEITAVLGDEEGERFCEVYDVREEGNFTSRESYHRSRNVLYLPWSIPMEPSCLESARERLFTRRMERPRPARDDKVITSWNGLAISAFAAGYEAAGDPRYLHAAHEAATFLLGSRDGDGCLPRTSRGGQPGAPGLLDDYAFLANGLVDLYQASGAPSLLAGAEELCGKMLTLFRDDHEGGFFLTPSTAAPLPARVRPLYDGAEPSGNAMAARALLRLGRLTGNTMYEEYARQTLEMCLVGAARMPQAVLKALCVESSASSPHEEATFTGPFASPTLTALRRALWMRYLPDVIVKHAESTDSPAVYWCANGVCHAPVTEPEGFDTLLDAPGRGEGG